MIASILYSTAGEAWLRAEKALSEGNTYLAEAASARYRSTLLDARVARLAQESS